MIIFAVDGKNDESALFECTCRSYLRRDAVEGKITATNHADNTTFSATSESSLKRRRRLDELVIQRNNWKSLRIPLDLIRILADDGVEQRGKNSFTVYSAIACPAEKRQWYTLGGYPAASRGN
jgi:hypothetical protein